MWIYAAITIVLLIILFTSYRKIKNNPGEHRSGLTFFLPGIIAIFILIPETTFNHPVDFKLVNHAAERIRCYMSWDEIIGDKQHTHPIRYSLVYSNGEEIPISKNTYQYFYNLWDNNGENTKEGIKNGFKVKDTKWNLDPGTSLTISKPVSYSNYIMNVYRVYDIYDIGIQKAIERGLIVRPGVGVVNNNNVLEPRQNLVLGINVGDSIQRKLNYVASLDPMFRPILLVWPNEEINKTKQQRNLWTGGKENEVVFCIGLGDKNKILWSGSFSWDESRKLENYILENVLIPGDTLNLDKYITALEQGYKNNYWNSINLEKYEFLKLPLNQLTTVLLMSIVVLINLILSVKLIMTTKKDK